MSYVKVYHLNDKLILIVLWLIVYLFGHTWCNFIPFCCQTVQVKSWQVLANLFLQLLHSALLLQKHTQKKHHVNSCFWTIRGLTSGLWMGAFFIIWFSHGLLVLIIIPAFQFHIADYPIYSINDVLNRRNHCSLWTGCIIVSWFSHGQLELIILPASQFRVVNYPIYSVYQWRPE